MERILFLDFDGVIITPRATLIANRGVVVSSAAVVFDPAAVAMVLRCCEAGARIVVSSSWRKLGENCRAILARCELMPYLHTDWCTRADDYKIADSRGKQIADWISNHQGVSYRILDDDADILPGQMPFFIRCHPNDGLSYDGMRNLFAWLKID